MDWIERLVVGLVVTIVAIVTVRVWDWLWRRKRLEAHRTALAVEIDICYMYARTYGRAKIQAPSYRLPTLIYTSSLADLIANGALSTEGIEWLIRFYSQVETVNRGLDQINQARFAGDSKAYLDEYNRNKIKAEELASNYYPRARGAIAPQPPWLIYAWFQSGP